MVHRTAFAAVVLSFSTLVACGQIRSGFEVPDDVQVPVSDGTTTALGDDASTSDGGRGTDATAVDARRDAATGDARRDASDAAREAAVPVDVVLPPRDASQTPPIACSTIRGTFTAPADAPVTLTGTTPVASGTVTFPPCGASVGAGLDAYTLTVTASARVVIDTIGSDFDTVLGLRRTCDDASTSVACNDDSVGLASLVDQTLTAGTYSILVGHYGSSTTAGNYHLNVHTVIPAVNAVCESATALTAEAPLTAQTLEAAGFAPAFTGCGFATGPVRYYTVTVPAQSTAVVTATRTAGSTSATPFLRALDTCTDTTCVTYSAISPSGDGARLAFANANGAPRTLVVALQSTYTQPASFDLSVAFGTVAPGSACDQPTSIVAPVTVSGTTVGAVTQVSPCGTSGAQAYYALTVAPSHRVRVTATSTGAATSTPVIAPIVRLVTDCAATTCLASNVGSATVPAVATYVNDSTDTLSLVVSVANNNVVADGTFDLTVDDAAIPPGALCSTATPLAVGTTLFAENTAGAVTTASPCYVSSGAGGQLFYSLDVPAGQRVDITATPTTGTGMLPVVRVIDGCTATAACLGSGIATATPVHPATASAYNTGTTTRSVVVTVASIDGHVDGTFDLSTTSAPIPTYAVEHLDEPATGGCDDLSGIASLATITATGGPFSDDSTSAVMALPDGFDFTYWGHAVTGYSVSSNGFIQLWPTLAGTPTSYLANGPLPGPSSTTVPGLVGALWDDLVPSGGSVTSAMVPSGRAPHFTVQWQNYAFFVLTATLTFQVQLYPGTNEIETHYCTLTSGDTARASGSSATVGIVDVGGVLASSPGHDTAGLVDTAHFYRFTPGATP